MASPISQPMTVPKPQPSSTALSAAPSLQSTVSELPSSAPLMEYVDGIGGRITEQIAAAGATVQRVAAGAADQLSQLSA